MAETAQPAAKLQKTDAGDVADACQAPASATPVADALPESVQAAEGVQQGHITEKAAASGNAAHQEKGKKRKVALYVAYIGAGYHVRRIALHITMCFCIRRGPQRFDNAYASVSAYKPCIAGSSAHAELFSTL